MRRYISLLLGILGFVPILAQQSDYYYYYNGERIDLTVDSTRLYVVSNGKFQLTNTYSSSDLFISKSVQSNIYNKGTLWNNQRVATPEIYFSTLEVPEGQNSEQYEALIEDIKSDDDVWQVLPSFTVNGDRIDITNNFMVKLKSVEDFSKLQRMAEQYGIDIVGNNKSLPLWYTLSCNAASSVNALEAANLFYTSGLFACSEPELCGQLSFASSDPYYNQQWNLKNIGQFCGIEGMDINVEEAWEITKGENTVVAVYDEAIYEGHEELSGNLHEFSYDIVTKGTSIYNMWTNGNHGNACAGIIVAEQNNEKGISGIAPESKVMSIAFGETEETDAEVLSSWVADGFIEACDNGADVISCSWSFNGWGTIVDDAIEYALDSGRNGKGCIVVFAAGNDNDGGDYYYDYNDVFHCDDPTLGDPIGYPANSNPRILTVGGITPRGRRTTKGMLEDGSVVTWSSNYGEELDVVAPSVLIYTTRYPNVQSSSTSLYNGGFGGTSAACPHAAGVAALILSVHPDLTADQVVSIIEYTAKKVNPDLYSYQTDDAHPNGTWNEEMGYGLIDAGAAVKIAYKASKTTVIKDELIDGYAYYMDYDVEMENVVVKDRALLEIYKEHNVLLQRNILIEKGGEFKIFKEPLDY